MMARRRQAGSPQRQNTILGHLVVARLSDQPHISGRGGQLEERGRSSIEVEAGVCG